MTNQTTIEEIREAFSKTNQYKEIWAETTDGQSTCVLINGDSGWLMYLRNVGDPGFSSRNPKYDGTEDTTQDYILNNGQLDEYPLSWTLPTHELLQAMEFFVKESKPAPWILWHNDSGDGMVISDVENQIKEIAEDVQELIDQEFKRVNNKPSSGSALDQAGLKDGKEIVEDYLSHGEAGIALEHIVYMIAETEINISPETKRKIIYCAQKFGVSDDLEKMLQG